MWYYLTLHSFQWCLRTRAMCSEGPPASEIAQLTAMAFDTEKVETQEGDDTVDEIFLNKWYLGRRDRKRLYWKKFVKDYAR